MLGESSKLASHDQALIHPFLYWRDGTFPRLIVSILNGMELLSNASECTEFMAIIF